MDITVYLPDDLALRAKAKPRGFISGVLREALEFLFAREDAVSATLEGAGTVTLELTTAEGRAYRGRMTATLIGEDAATDSRVYLRQSGEVITYHASDRRYRVVEHPEDELAEVLSTDAYIEAMAALGIVPEIDLDAHLPAASSTTAPSAAATAGRNRLRSVPSELVVEPSVNLLKRLTGHGDASKETPTPDDDPRATVEVEPPEAAPAIVEAALEPEMSTT